MRIPNPGGNFHFTRGSAFYASAVIADPGFEIVRAVFENPLPLNAGFNAIQRELKNQGRPVKALCGIELRAPAPYANQASFTDFNSTYVDRLRSLGLLVDERVPLTRANLAVTDASVDQQCVYAFLYTIPSMETRPTFATSAVANLKFAPDGTVDEPNSREGLKEHVSLIARAVDEKIREIGANWALATQVRIYTVQPISDFFVQIILPLAGLGARHGLNWYYVLPPVQGMTVEIDVRGLLKEVVLR